MNRFSPRYIARGLDKSDSVIAAEVQSFVLTKNNLLENVSTASFVDRFNALDAEQKKLENEMAVQRKNQNSLSVNFSGNREKLELIKKEKQVFLKIAQQAVQQQKTTMGSEEEMREIVEFSRMKDGDFVKFLLSILKDADSSRNPLFLQTMKLVLLNQEDEFYVHNVNFLIELAEFLEEKITAAHMDAQAYHDVIDRIETLHVTWLALSLSGLQSLNKALWDRQCLYFKTLSNDRFHPIAYRARLMHQMLARIDYDKTNKWKEDCMRAFKLLSGCALIVKGALGTNLGDVAVGVLKVWDASKTHGIREGEWFKLIMLLEAEIGETNKSITNFQILVSNMSVIVKTYKRNLNLSYGLFELIQRLVLSSSVDPIICIEAIRLLKDMYIDKKKWHADVRVVEGQGRGDGDNDLREQIIRTLYVLTFSKEMNIKDTAGRALEELKTHYLGKRGKSVGRAILNNTLYDPDNKPQDDVINVGLKCLLTRPNIAEIKIETANQLLNGYIQNNLMVNFADQNASAFDFEEKKELPAKINFSQSIPQVASKALLRPKLNAIIDSMFANEKKQNHPPIVVIQGVPGIGKTQLAIEYVNTYMHEKEFIFWVHQGDADKFYEQWVEMGSKLVGRYLANIPRAEQLALIKETLMAHRSWIIVLDNMRDPTQLVDLFPDNLAYEQQIIITTRNPNWHASREALVMQPFSSYEVADYFCEMGVSEDDQEGMSALAAELENLPLALAYAISYMKAENISAKVCYDRFLESGLKLFSKTTLHKISKLSKAHHHENVYETYRIIIEELKASSPDTLILVNYCALLDAQSMNKNLLLSILKWDEHVFAKHLQICRQYNILLIEQDQVSMSALTQSAIRHYFLSTDNVHINEVRLNTIAREICERYPMEKTKSQHYKEARQLIRHLEAVISSFALFEAESKIRGSNSNLRQSLLKLYNAAYNFYETVSGEHKKLLTIAISIYKLEDVRGSLDKAEAHNKVGSANCYLGNAALALKHHTKALNIYQKIHGKKFHSSVAECHNFIGKVHLLLHKNKEAVEGHDKACAIYGSCRNDFSLMSRNRFSLMSSYDFSLMTSYLYSALAQNYIQPLGAIKCLKENVLQVCEKYYDKDHPIMADIYSGLAIAYINLKHYRTALGWCANAKEIRLAVYGEVHPLVAESDTHLASVYSGMGQIDKAFHHYQSALKIYLAVYTTHPRIAEINMVFGHYYKTVGNINVALNYFKTARSIYSDFKLDSGVEEAQSVLDNLGPVAEEKIDFGVDNLALRTPDQSNRRLSSTTSILTFTGLPPVLKPEKDDSGRGKRKSITQLDGLPRSPLLSARDNLFQLDASTATFTTMTAASTITATESKEMTSPGKSRRVIGQSRPA